FRFEGKAYRVVPDRHSDVTFAWVNPSIQAKRLEKFRFREWNNPDAYHDENIRRIIGNYWLSVTKLTDKYKEIGKPDSAKYWLNWGEKHIPFNISSNNINSVALYAHSYASVGDDSSAVALAEKAQEQLITDLKSDMGEFNKLQQRISELDQQMNNARQNADMKQRKRLQQQVQRVSERRQQLTRGISFAISHLTIVQRIYYMAGLDEQASTLANRVDALTGGQISLPTSKEENKKQVDQFQIN